MAVSQARTERRGRVLGDVVAASRVHDALLVIGYAGLVGLVAQIAIPLPFTPVPITGQTFGVLVGGMALGWRRAGLGMALYAVAGLAGLPWFSQAQGGLNTLQAPSFGYIIGFVAAGPVLGRLAQLGLDRHPAATLLAMAAGNVVIYAFGVAWLVLVVHLSLVTALALGVAPFLIGDAIKALLAAGLLPAVWKVARQ